MRNEGRNENQASKPGGSWALASRFFSSLSKVLIVIMPSLPTASSSSKKNPNKNTTPMNEMENKPFESVADVFNRRLRTLKKRLVRQSSLGGRQ